ncbi:MAG: hypothetical protein SVX43_20365 [Cyanobacteriota bacterium]|nr:hypothetical protein [Cyanobacteriota bacterium]
MQLLPLQLRSLRVTPFMLLALTAACSQTPQTPETTASPSPLSFPSPIAPASPSSPPRPASDLFADADDTAQGAIALTQSAVSSEDWQMVVRQWERAIALLESIPDSDPQKEIAREKLVGYRENLAYAQQQAQKKAPQQPQQQQSVTPQSPWIANVGRSSSENSPEESPKVALAKHLNRVGAKMYGITPCEKCQEQREKFGEAFSQVVEIECNPSSDSSAQNDNDPCQQAGVKTLPAWEINGQLHPGVRSLEELADLSQYQGDRNFSRES